MATTARVQGVDAEVSMKARAHRWEVSYARLEDATPTIWNPGCVVNDAAAPGTGRQLCGTVVALDVARSIAVLDFTPGAVFRHNVRTVLTYAGAVENSWAAILEGSPVYYDRSATMPAGCYLSLSPLDNLGAANPLFGFVALDPLEVPFLARAAGAGGNTFGCAVMQVPAIPNTAVGVAADVVAVGALTAVAPDAATALAMPAGGAGAAAGCWDTGAHRDDAITDHAELLTDFVSLRTQLTAAVADLATLQVKLNLLRTNLEAAGLMA